jgi:PAS domain S-box-containing protein
LRQRGPETKVDLGVLMNSQMLFDHIGISLMSVREDATISQINREFEILSGFSKAQVEGKMTWAGLILCREKHEAGNPSGRIPTMDFLEQPDFRDAKIRTSDGSLRDVMVRATRIPGTSERLYVLLDITERKRIEAEGKRLAAIVQHSSEFVNLADFDGNMIFLNEAGSKALGIDPNDVRATKIMQVVPDDLKPKVANEIIPSIMAGGSWSGDLQCLNQKTGAITDTHTSAFVIDNSELFDEKYLANISIDISQRKQTERILAENEARLRNITANLPGVVYQFIANDNGEYRLTYTSEQWRDFFGFPPETEPSYQILLSNIYEEDLERFLTSVRETLAKAVPWNFVGRFVKPSGELIWFQGLSTPTRHADFTVFDGIMLNITECKQAEEMSRQAEEKFAKIFITIPNCIVISRMEDGRIMDVNPGFEEIIGWKREEVLGRKISEFKIWDKQATRNAIVNELKAGGIVLQREYAFRRKDGLLRKGIFSFRPIQIAGEKCLISIMHDITDRRAEEAERARLQEMLFQSQKMEMVGRLAGGVAHDFNNMLGVILGNAEMAMRQVDPSQPLHAELKEIYQAAKRSAELTQQLLAFARKQTIAPAVVDLNDAISAMLKMLRRLIGEHISLEWIPGDNLGRVKIDPAQFSQILTNLCVNSRDAIDGVGRIIIQTQNVTSPPLSGACGNEENSGEYVLLTVSDSGSGMEKDVLDHLFEPFFTTKGVGYGSGLGLATVYGIVEQNGGSISVESKPGCGSTFKILLPYGSGEAPAAGPVPKGKPKQGHGETVLLVEDEPAILTMGKAMLQRLGYTVLAAATPSEATELAEAHGRDICLMISDVIMPAMNGQELATQIRRIKPDLKCLFMSGYTADVIARQGILHEGVHFLQKPFSNDELATKIRDVLEQK